MKKTIAWIGLGACLAVSGAGAGESLFDRAPWTASAGLEWLKFEGDQVVKDGPALGLRLGHTFNPRWSMETGLILAPRLKNRSFSDERYALGSDIWLARVPVDTLFHLRNIENLRWDPYVSFGFGFTLSEKDLGRGSFEPFAGVGAGMFYHVNDQWAVRADVRGVLNLLQTEWNAQAGLGVQWRWQARVPPRYRLEGGELDSDGDGLPDWFERQIGTDPFNPDTDGDGLSDYEEVILYGTDPLNPDTDYDGLSDGAEIHVYGTDPLNPDTDGGGVADGHEVIEDGTDPLDPADDLQLFTLNIEFDYDKADLKPRYHDLLDVVVKVLHRDPGATARIEGHADRRPRSQAEYNRRLSVRRAESVANYISRVGGIEGDRLTAVGYGFDRPVAPNDTEANMQRNRRTEIYIRPGPTPPPDTD